MNLSPAAQAFWGSVIRHALTALAGVLVAHGYVSNDVAHPYIEEAVGLTLQGVVMVWANRIVYWQQIRAIVGRAMPAATHVDVIAKVEELKDAKALPSVFTAPTAVPSLVKPLLLIVGLLGGGLLLPACAPPPTIVTQPGRVAFLADQVVVRVNEFEKAVIQAEATGGLPIAHARVYIAWSVSADKVLKASPAGWQATLVASWTEAKGQVPAPTNPSIAALAAGIDATLASLGGVR